MLFPTIVFLIILVERIPPYAVYKEVELDVIWTQTGPKGYTLLASGWMETPKFSNLLQQMYMYIPAVKLLVETEPVVLIVDGHYSHETVSIYNC